MSLDEQIERLNTYVESRLQESNTAFQRLKEYNQALEASRRDLMGLNEELREKIGALERGQLDLQEKYLPGVRIERNP